MKIATWNVNSIRKRLPLLLDWLAQNSPDVLCLQETKVQDEAFPLEALQSAGYHVTFRGRKGYNGVATLTLRRPEGRAIAFGAMKGEVQPLGELKERGVTLDHQPAHVDPGVAGVRDHRPQEFGDAASPRGGVDIPDRRPVERFGELLVHPEHGV